MRDDSFREANECAAVFCWFAMGTLAWILILTGNEVSTDVKLGYGLGYPAANAALLGWKMWTHHKSRIHIPFFPASTPPPSIGLDSSDDDSTSSAERYDIQIVIDGEIREVGADTNAGDAASIASDSSEGVEMQCIVEPPRPW